MGGPESSEILLLFLLHTRSMDLDSCSLWLKLSGYEHRDLYAQRFYVRLPLSLSLPLSPSLFLFTISYVTLIYTNEIIFIISPHLHRRFVNMEDNIYSFYDRTYRGKHFAAMDSPRMYRLHICTTRKDNFY